MMVGQEGRKHFLDTAQLVQYNRLEWTIIKHTQR